MSRTILRSTVSEKGQVTIPKAVRDRLGLKPGQVLEFQARDGQLVGRKVPVEVDPVDAVTGVLRHLNLGVDELINEMRGKPWNPEDDAPRAHRR